MKSLFKNKANHTSIWNGSRSRHGKLDFPHHYSNLIYFARSPSTLILLCSSFPLFSSLHFLSSLLFYSLYAAVHSFTTLFWYAESEALFSFHHIVLLCAHYRYLKPFLPLIFYAQFGYLYSYAPARFTPEQIKDLVSKVSEVNQSHLRSRFIIFSCSFSGLLKKSSL